MTTRRVVVVGADAAGMSAAHQAIRANRARGEEIEVVALEMTQDTSYSACGLPYWVAGDVDDADELVARSPERHRELGIDLRLGATATELDVKDRKLTYRTSAGDTIRIGYDDLVIATGAAPVIPDWARTTEGAMVPGVRPLKDMTDGHAWLRTLNPTTSQAPAASPSPRRGIVVGGGYVGVEMAEAMHRRGWETTLITRTRVMSNLDPDMSARLETVIESAGVTVIGDTQVSELRTHPDGSVAAAVTDDGTVYPADAIVVAMGVRPATGFASLAGLPVGKTGGLLADESGRVAPGVWAAGDCCEVKHRVTGKWTFAPLGTHANKQGKTIGENLAGGEARFQGVLGTAITRFVAGDHHVEVARTGLSTAEAEEAGFTVASLVTEGRTASGYMPEASPIAVKVIADAYSRRLMGMQIIGGRAAGKRIDTAAASLWAGLSVDDLASMDLAYAPPFATVWEVVQLAARRLADRM
ncbi:FAD-dependent oxidoreductase [Nocardioides sp. WS12]|uniref:FAD-dependent oxidoreductase n=1 Tax=Nocardioides sp. WS12 TaxID=2486272 RepID=UPI0023516FDE|nr:FAD-dependent oxidoreductase [Nocardioides sp. WS12]